MDGDFKLGGGWGRHVSLLKPDEFHKLNLERDVVQVVGHHTPRPREGQTLVGEFQKSWIKFRFVRVDLCDDPSDMFFAEVRAIEQQLK